MQPSAIRDVHDLSVRLRAENPDRKFIALHFGEPDLGTPDFIVEAGCAALRAGVVFYEDNHGRPDLRKALGQHFNLEPERFLVTCGAVQAICLTMFSLVRPGDDVIILTPPLWPNFTEAARMAGANIHEVPLRFNDHERCFELDDEAIEAVVADAKRLRMIVVNSPSNPTGWTITPVQQRKLLSLSQRNDVYLLTDEIYGRILAPTARFESWNRYLTEFDKLLVINGFSKVYCMTGWRVGYLIGEPTLINEMGRLQEFVTSHAPGAAQVAGIAALRDGEPFIASSSER
jgi:aspartate/methionine/tyrosine aminotransferase